MCFCEKVLHFRLNSLCYFPPLLQAESVQVVQLLYIESHWHFRDPRDIKLNR
jgi:hypothetical protein